MPIGGSIPYYLNLIGLIPQWPIDIPKQWEGGGSLLLFILIETPIGWRKDGGRKGEKEGEEATARLPTYSVVVTAVSGNEGPSGDLRGRMIVITHLQAGGE